MTTYIHPRKRIGLEILFERGASQGKWFSGEKALTPKPAPVKHGRRALSDCKPEPSERLLLAASAIVMDDLDQFPNYRLDTHFDRTIATARLQSENL
jgi:hypothetical protein